MKTKLLLVVMLFINLTAAKAGWLIVNFPDTTATGNINSLVNIAGTATNTECCLSMTVKMTIKYKNLPSDWNIGMCTPTGCHPTTVVTTTFSLGPSKNGPVKLDFWTGYALGTGTATVRWENASDPTDFVEKTFSVAVSATGVNENEFAEFNLFQNYPNPFNQYTTIKYNPAISGGYIVITDFTGKKIREYNLQNSSGELIINEKLQSGVYFYSIYSNDKMIAANKMFVL